MVSSSQKIKKRYLGGIAIVVLLILLARVALNDNIAVREYTVRNAYISGDYTFVVLTDLHSTFYGEDQEQLAQKIMEYDPDGVFLVGDIADDSEERKFGGVEALLGHISERYPCYYVTGNHERWLTWTDDIHGLFEKHGATVLSGRSVELEGRIVLHGIDDPLFYGGREGFLEVLGGFEPSDTKFDILLSHRPEYAEDYARLGFDLTLSGHAHGGQVRIPLILNGLYSPNQGWFPEYAGGRYDFEGGTVIVSRGLMIDELPRVFNRPEVVVVKVAGAEK